MNPKRKDSQAAYKIVLQDAAYTVIMERLKNTHAGALRFRALIIPINTAEFNAVAVYNFTGHYLCEKQEAEFIARYHHIGAIKGGLS